MSDRFRKMIATGALVLAVVMFPDSYALAAASVQDLRLAYLDPGTGALIVQAIMVAVATVAMTMRGYWGRIKGLFRSSSPAKEKATSDPPTNA